MEMQQLRYVIAVARTANFSRAAEPCHVSQPSFSQQIQKLGGDLVGAVIRPAEARGQADPHGEAQEADFRSHESRQIDHASSPR